MKLRRRCRLLLTILLPAVLVCLCTAVAWVASTTETGWTVLALQWRAATLGWFVADPLSIATAEPTDQADFWLHEVDRILDAEPPSAAATMAAAWVLDTPTNGFMYRYLKKPSDFPSFIPIGFYYEACERAKKQFEEKCKHRCLALAAEATRMEPENVHWWRMRALLQFRDGTCVGDREPRASDWRDVLHECARHDPDNALYDYLAARSLWDVSLPYEPTGIVVKDPQRFAEGISYFERGQRKKHLVVGEVGLPAIAAFLDRSVITPQDRIEIANSRYTKPLLLGLWRHQCRRADIRLQEGDAAAALVLYRESLRPLNQCAAADDEATMYGIGRFVRVAALSCLRSLAEKHPRLISTEEKARIEARYEAAILNAKVLEKVSNTIERRQTSLWQRMFTLPEVLWGGTVSPFVLLLAVSLVALAAGRRLNRNRRPVQPNLGIVRHVLAWFVAYGLSFAVLGMAPAEIIPRKAHGWIACALAGLVVIGLAAWWARRRRFQYSLRALLGFMLGCCLVCAVVAWTELDPWMIVDLPSRFWLPVRGWEGVNADILKNAVKANSSPWQWATLQWLAFGGVYIGLAGSLLLVALWYAVRRARRSSQSVSSYWRSRDGARWAGLLGCLGRSAGTAALCCLLVYLALTPGLLRSIDRTYQQRMAYVRNPEQYWVSFRAEMEQVRADPILMQQFRDAVKEEMAVSEEEE